MGQHHRRMWGRCLKLATVLMFALSGLGLTEQTVDEHVARGQELEAAGELDEALSTYSELAKVYPDDWRGFLLRGQVHFRLADNKAALNDFDRVVELAPEREPGLWQRGISQYYEGQYAACRSQFELHRTVNPNDVENAIWHFLCRARSAGVAAARADLLAVGPDSRVPMREVYELFKGAIAPEAVLAVAKDGRGPRDLERFYANLYVGLYMEALGNKDAALKYLHSAADSGVGGYMGDVARLHVKP